MKMNRYSALASPPAVAAIGVTIEAAKPGPAIGKYVYGQFAVPRL
ncbi:hypothetical protein [Duganella vulcania]|nr:hypothetical protein [Duganella vulcania]